jgi:hypothetical protein
VYPATRVVKGRTVACHLYPEAEPHPAGT